MNPLQSVLVTARRWFTSHLRFPRDRVGTVTLSDDGQAFTVYRETTIVRPSTSTSHPSSAAVLAFRFHLWAMPQPLVPYVVRLFEPLSILTTPFFAGLPGFRTKLWQFDHGSGDYQGIYEWATADQARTYAAGLSRIMDFLAIPGSVSYEVCEGETIDAYLVTHTPDRSRGAPRRRTVRRLLTGVVAVAVAVGVGWAIERQHERSKDAISAGQSIDSDAVGS